MSEAITLRVQKKEVLGRVLPRNVAKVCRIVSVISDGGLKTPLS